jgi:hypothetical protein
MKIKTCGNCAVALAGALIIGGCLVVAGALVCGCIIKLSKKINGPAGGGGGQTNTVDHASYTETVRDTRTGQMVSILSLNLATNAPARIMVQRWFPDAPEEFLYITDADAFHEFGITDPNPPEKAGFYHIYLVIP